MNEANFVVKSNHNVDILGKVHQVCIDFHCKKVSFILIFKIYLHNISLQILYIQHYIKKWIESFISIFNNNKKEAQLI